MNKYTKLIAERANLINFSYVDDSVSSIKYAILNRRPIKFTYIKPGGSITNRIGNPYVLFRYVKRSGRTKYSVWMLDLVQTKGQSDTLKLYKDGPTFRRFRVNRIRNVEVDESRHFKPIHKDYNPFWEKYNQATKVSTK